MSQFFQQSRSTAVINKFRAPKGNVNVERSYEICRAVVQKSANKNIIAEQVTLKPAPSGPVGVAVSASQASQGQQPKVEFLAPTTVMTTMPTVTPAGAPATVILAPVNPVIPSTSAPGVTPFAVAVRPPQPPVSVVVSASTLTSAKVGNEDGRAGHATYDTF